jgi:hypothetical protein
MWSSSFNLDLINGSKLYIRYLIIFYNERDGDFLVGKLLSVVFNRLKGRVLFCG